MAKKRSQRKLEPAVKTLEFDLTGAQTIGYIDLGQCTSIVNRRFYRQGLQWAVAGMRIQTLAAGPTGVVSIEKLPETWVVGAAWQKAMETWSKQQQRVLEDAGSESVKGRYNDFKIYADHTHTTIGWANNLTPIDTLSVPFLKGEWEPSQIVIPNDSGTPGNTVEYEMKMTGNSTASHKSIIAGYQAGRSVPFSPDPATQPVPGASWLNDVFNDGETTDLVMANAADRNDELPYDQLNYPGSGGNANSLELVQREIFSSTTIGRTVHVPGFIAPCGLIKVSTDTPIRIYVYLVPGAHRGYLCEPMQEMN